MPRDTLLILRARAVLPICRPAIENGAVAVSGGRIQSQGGWDWRYRGEGVDPYQREHDALFAAIRAGTPHDEADYGAHSTMTAILGRLATYSGRLVTFDEALASNISLAPKRYAFDATAPVLPDAHGNYQSAIPGVTPVL